MWGKWCMFLRACTAGSGVRSNGLETVPVIGRSVVQISGSAECFSYRAPEQGPWPPTPSHFRVWLTLLSKRTITINDTGGDQRGLTPNITYSCHHDHDKTNPSVYKRLSIMNSYWLRKMSVKSNPSDAWPGDVINETPGLTLVWPTGETGPLPWTGTEKSRKCGGHLELYTISISLRLFGTLDWSLFNY